MPAEPSQPQRLETVSQMRAAVKAARSAGRSVGCVPTMGALHEGHAELIRAGRAGCNFLVTTIFVNPTQFGPGEDFARYPRTLPADLEVCRKAGVDAVFLPQADALYSPNHATWVTVEGYLAETLEGSLRPGHFRGVTTIVMKLFNIVLPDRAWFGQKDFQQQLLIRRMVADLDLPVEVLTVPTVRETDGLALSSRNRYLDSEQRTTALTLWRSLGLAEERLRQGASGAEAESAMWELLDTTENLNPDYAVVVDPETLRPVVDRSSNFVALVAGRVGSTRLIDNRLIQLD